MSKKLIVILAGVFSFYLAHFAQASVIINEVMYDPAEGSSHEWIEIYNNGDQINLEGWRFFNNQDDSSPLRTSGSFIMESNSYAIIAGSGNAISFSGQIFTSSNFSLPNDSSKYKTYKAISDPNKTIINSVTYDTNLGGRKDSGNSLQLADSSWISATPTPGEANNAKENLPPGSSSVDDSDSNDSSTSDSESTVETTTKTKTKTAVQKIKTEITANLLAYVGIPFSLEGKTFGTNGQQLFIGKYFWNFGDGDFRETQVINNEKFLHTYFYPGEYTVLLEYYPNIFTDVPDASQKINIKVIAPQVSISNVGDAKDFFVELFNNTDYVADLSNWHLISTQKSFTIPRNTILAAKKKIIISSKITGFTLVDKDTLKLFNSEREVMFSYTTSPQPLPEREGQNSKPISVFPSPLGRVQGGVNPKTILASSINNSISQPKSETNTSNSSPIFLIVFLFFIGASASAVYFIRRKRIIPKIESDFEILDE